MNYYVIDYLSGTYIIRAETPQDAKQKGFDWIKNKFGAEANFSVWARNVPDPKPLDEQTARNYIAEYPDRDMGVGAVTTPPVNPVDPVDPTGDPVEPGKTLENQGLYYPAYLRAQQGKYGDVSGQGYFNESIRNRYQPTLGAFFGQDVLGNTPDDPNDPDKEAAFQDYARRISASGGGYSKDAANSLAGLRGYTGQDLDVRNNIEAIGSDENYAQRAYDLARGARRQRFSGLLDRAAPSFNDTRAGFLASTGGTMPGSGNAWLNYLKRVSA